MWMGLVGETGTEKIMLFSISPTKVTVQYTTKTSKEGSLLDFYQRTALLVLEKGRFKVGKCGTKKTLFKSGHFSG